MTQEKKNSLPAVSKYRLRNEKVLSQELASMFGWTVDGNSSYEYFYNGEKIPVAWRETGSEFLMIQDVYKDSETLVAIAELVVEAF